MGSCEEREYEQGPFVEQQRGIILKKFREFDSLLTNEVHSLQQETIKVECFHDTIFLYVYE